MITPKALFAQAPANDNCANASRIFDRATGNDIDYSYGSFVSDTFEITSATKQTGEYAPPQHTTRGLGDKSIWYRFTIKTTLQVQIILKQPGLAATQMMQPQDAGWVLYRTSSCLPTAAEIVDPPVVNIEGYTHQCLAAGTYLVQVNTNFTATDSLYLELNVSPSTAIETRHDYASNPLNFGILSGNSLPPIYNQNYLVGCQSHFENEPLCPNSNFNQTTWHIFRTDSRADHVRVEINENPWNVLLSGPRQYGYQLYKGDARADSTTLLPVGPCRTFTANSSGNYGFGWHNCELEPNTTYTIKFYFPHRYSNRINIRLYEVGSQATRAPDHPTIPPTNQLGVLPYGTWIDRTDMLSCNAFLRNQTPCALVNPPSGYYLHWGDTLDLSTWYSFEITQPAYVNFFVGSSTRTSWWWWWGWSTPGFLVRLYSGYSTDPGGCSNLSLYTQYRTASNDLRNVGCLPAGKYTVQLVGMNNPRQAHSNWSNLAKNANFSAQIIATTPHLYNLSSYTAVDTVNNGIPLVSGNTYNTRLDNFNCLTTVLPAGDVCGWANDRAIYRLIQIGQDGILTVGGGDWSRFRYRLYRGNARDLPVVGNRIQGLVDQAGCQSTYFNFKVCVTPGWYTLVTFGDISDINQDDRPWVRFESFPPTLFTDPANPNVITNAFGTNPIISSTTTRFYCTDNPMTIMGYPPCAGTTKQTYHEFYVDSAVYASFGVWDGEYMTPWWEGTVQARIFNGRISNGTLTGLFRDCNSGFSLPPDPCGINPRWPVGWYTVVMYGISGKTFQNPTYTTGLGGIIGNTAGFSLTRINQWYYTPQRYSTFATADTTFKVNPISWAPNNGHTARIPRNHLTFQFPTDYFDCDNNLPFPNGVQTCSPSYNRTSYRVFTLARPSYVLIDGTNPWPGGYLSRLYQGDIRTQTPPFTQVHGCFNTDARLCLPAGTYTLVTFAGNSHLGRSISPYIYVDSLGTSKFDHASNAYNFSEIPNDNTEYRTRPGHPLGPYGRAGSNDFFFCTTGHRNSDPINHGCYLGQHGPPNPLPNPTVPRRNLWYTFTVTGPGDVFVSVYNLTPRGNWPYHRGRQSPFVVYRSNSTAFPPADSTTTAPGTLSFVVSSTHWGWWCGNVQTVRFFRDPCVSNTTTRYYVLVDNDYYNEPNTQIEVGIRFAPAPPTYVRYDFYSDANRIGGNPTERCDAPYPADSVLSTGTYTGCIGNLTCATRSAPDQNTCGTKTLWYTFVVNRSGRIRINYDRPNGSTTFNDNDIQLYREVVPGDSTNGGLVRVPLTTLNASNPDFNPPTVYPWGEGCMQPSRYYIMFTGCNFPTETVRPRIWLLPELGDLCNWPGEIKLHQHGTRTLSLPINCLTIGEAPGEDGTNMGCLGLPTNQKSQWLKVVVPDTMTRDTVDIDIQLLNGTNIPGNQIRYRVAYGDCNGMTFDNCVSEGIHIMLNLRCRLPGTYWIQTIMPAHASGQIDYRLALTPRTSLDCTPLNPIRPLAAFQFVAGCDKVPVYFTNLSTTGPDMSYKWDFGDGSTSDELNPIIQYAVPDTYLVRLVALKRIQQFPLDTTLTDTIIRRIIIQPKPKPTFTIPDTVTAGEPFLINSNPTDTITTSLYYWDFCAASGHCGAQQISSEVSKPGMFTYRLGGLKRMCFTIYNEVCDSTTCKEVFVKMTNIYAGGPNDGFGRDTMNSPCLPVYLLGGPYDGADQFEFLENCFQNIFAGGHDDGFGVDMMLSDCPVTYLTGGPIRWCG